MLGKLHDWVSVGAAKGQGDSEKPVVMIGLGFPNKELDMEDPNAMSPENFDDQFITLAAAKALVMDLQETIDAIMNGTGFKP